MNIGTIGTGTIVERFLDGVNKVEGVHCKAVYSRNLETAQTLASKFDITQTYTSLDELFSDNTINTIYVASPNSLHFEQSKEALLHGYHVICEKPFTSTKEELAELIAIAKEKKLFLFEAITTLHLPNYKWIKENLSSLGELKMVQCNFSQYSSKYDSFRAGNLPNVFNPKFSGGALMDINLYNLQFVLGLFGAPKKVNYIANTFENGIDTSGVLVLTYNHFIATCIGCKDSKSKNLAQIQGDQGYMIIPSETSLCSEVIVETKESLHINMQTEANPLYYELKDFYEIYQKQDFEARDELLAKSSIVIDVLVQARKDAKIIFDADKSN